MPFQMILGEIGPKGRSRPQVLQSLGLKRADLAHGDVHVPGLLDHEAA